MTTSPPVSFSHFGISVTAPIERETEALCGSRPGFMTRAERRAAQVTRMAAAR